MKNGNATLAGTRMARDSEAVSTSTTSISPSSAPAQAATSSPSSDVAHIATFWKSARNRREAIQVSLKSFEGHAYLDARIFVTNAQGQMLPTRRGIAVGIKTLPLFAKAVGDGLRKAIQLGLMGASS